MRVFIPPFPCQQERLRGWLWLSHMVSGLFSFPAHSAAELQRQLSSHLPGVVLQHQERGREEEWVQGTEFYPHYKGNHLFCGSY